MDCGAALVAACAWRSRGPRAPRCCSRPAPPPAPPSPARSSRTGTTAAAPAARWRRRAVRRIPNVRVELYTAAGSFSASTNTNAAGRLQLHGPRRGHVHGARRQPHHRVDPRRRLRGGHLPAGADLPHQRGDRAPRSPSTDRVGGQNPALIDAGSGASGTTLASLTTATTTPQSITTVVLAAAGDDRLRRRLRLQLRHDREHQRHRAGLAAPVRDERERARPARAPSRRSGLTAGFETSIFMIPNGVANPGQNTGYANQLDRRRRERRRGAHHARERAARDHRHQHDPRRPDPDRERARHGRRRRDQPADGRAPAAPSARAGPRCRSSAGPRS